MAVRRVLHLGEIGLDRWLKFPVTMHLLPSVLEKLTNSPVEMVNRGGQYTEEIVAESPHSTIHIDVACI